MANRKYTPLIKEKLDPMILTYKPCAILMGRTGTGKTTLANKLCGTTHNSGAARGSMTKELFRNDVSCGNAFSLIDTPGIDSATETYKHAVLLKEGLTATKINTIFVVIKYDNRFEKMVDSYLEVEKPVSKYQKKIVVLVSYMDATEEPNNDFIGIKESFKEEAPNIANIIFFSRESSENEIAELMYSCVSLMDKEKIKINKKEFHLTFNIYEMKSQMKKSFQQYKTDVRSIEKDYTDLISDTTRTASAEDKDEVIHMIIVSFKGEVENLLEVYKERHSVDMIELESYTFYIKMQKENVKICDKFVDNVVPLMSYSLFDTSDPRNFIKRCPHCQEIWIKTEGCDGATNCGNRGFDNFYDIGFSSPFKYIVRRINGKLRWEKKPVGVKEMKSTPKFSTNSAGCGKKIVWSELPKVEDALILELYKVKTIEEAIKLIKAEDFNNIRQDYEKSINKEFQI